MDNFINEIECRRTLSVSWVVFQSLHLLYLICTRVYVHKPVHISCVLSRVIVLFNLLHRCSGVHQLHHRKCLFL